MKSIRIIGAGGHGKVVAEIAEITGYDDIAFFDQRYPEKQLHLHWLVLGLPQAAGPGQELFCGIGDNQARSGLFQKLACADSPNLIHPNAILSRSARLGAGNVMMAGSIANASVQIGNGVIINTASSIDHDAIIADFVHISPGVHIAGGVQIGQRSWIGIGASIRESVKIGCDVMVGAGAAVVSDIPDGARVGGVPARPI